MQMCELLWFLLNENKVCFVLFAYRQLLPL